MNDWQAFLDPNVKAFIAAHEHDDVRDLALKKQPNLDCPYPFILDQIKARQKAANKVPQWLEHENIIFPSADTIEQASSAATAKYKARLFKGKHFTDLTGGSGIDSWAMLENFESATIIDTDEQTAQCLKHNFSQLTNKPIEILHQTAEEYIQSMSDTDLVLIDPQRRTKNRKGLYRLEDCSPNILDLLRHTKAHTLVLKTSPMLDINQGIEQLSCVKEVHVVQWQGECKELLFILKPNEPEDNPVSITASEINNDGNAVKTLTFTRESESATNIKTGKPLQYLYEPGPAFTKSGAYKSLANAYGLSKLHAHTHLYTSEEKIESFPGKCLKIEGIYPVQAKAIPVQKANLVIRNFPQDTQTLRKKLKLNDGGNDYLFACTLEDGKYALIYAQKF